MNSEGSLALALATLRGKVASVDVQSSRRARAASALAGRTPSEVLRIVPLLFPVCGMAQTIACARAIEAALGRVASPELHAARERLCLAEAVASHVWQLAIAWREAAGVASDPGAVRAARRALDAISRGLFAPAALGRALREEDATHEVRAATRDLAALVHQLTASEPPLVRAVRAAGRSSFGASGVKVRAAAELDADAIGARLAADRAFAERPELDGAPIDPSAYARARADAEVQRVEAEHGRGLLARLVAANAAAVADAHALAESAPGHTAPPSPSAARGVGAGMAETARGPLVFWVRTSVDAVEDVRVVAPTEWRLHPYGVLASSLVGADATSTLARDAGWLVLALDPCVPWTIEVRHA